MIGDIILWLRRIRKEMFCIHEYEWRELTEKERTYMGYTRVHSILVCKNAVEAVKPIDNIYYFS